MTIVFSGSERDALSSNNSAAAETTDTSIERFNRLGFQAGFGVETYVQTNAFDPLPFAALRLWLGTPPGVFDNPGDRTFIEALDAQGRGMVRLWSAYGTPGYVFQYSTGTGWASVGDLIALPQSSFYGVEWTLSVDHRANPSVFKLFGNGELRLTATAPVQLSPTARFRVWNTNNYFGIPVSGLIVSDKTLVGMARYTLPPVADGSDIDGEGTYRDVAEVILRDDTGIGLTASGMRRSMKPPVRALEGKKVEGITVAARARAEEDGPQSLRFYLLLGRARFYSPPIPLSVAYTPCTYTWSRDPRTNKPWVTSAVEAPDLEWGWEAGAEIAQ